MSIILIDGIKTVRCMIVYYNHAYITTFCVSDINKGLQVVSLLSDAMCKACKDKGDLECIKRHCLLVEYGPDGKFVCFFELILNVPVNSDSHVGTFPPFYGTFIKMKMPWHPTSALFEAQAAHLFVEAPIGGPFLN